MIIAIWLIISILFFAFAAYCCVRVGANADTDNYTQEMKERGKQMTSNCEKCAQTFSWFEDDALVKYGYGDKYILHCPHCDKLTKVTKNSNYS
jgi:endogenous inhibitor of DNA gyrase (YacG/DUF329 family)